MGENDRKLLEAAAKAAGIDLHRRYMFNGNAEPGFYEMSRSPPEWCWWNPLADDGDALRLAVKLRLKVIIGPRKAVVSTDSADVIMAEFLEPDPCAATRRAILRAAAEIGRDGGEGHG